MASPTPDAPSPASSQGSFQEPDLPQLVNYLLQSKRALSSVSLVWRARELVDSGREALEENASLHASSAFVRVVLDKQIDGLEAIRYGADVLDNEGSDEFQATVQSLDDASSRLQHTLESLKSTLVEASLRPADEEPKHLFDFVDEAGIGDLEESIKGSIDRFEAARSKLAETCAEFDQDLRRLHESTVPPSKAQEEAEPEDLDGSTPAPALFKRLEIKATDAAGHLEALVKHYDLCVTALKHTEGGDTAITQASTGEEQQESAMLGLGLDLGQAENAAPKSITPEERLEMLHVLVADADEVEDVVNEMKVGVAEMEDEMSEITAYLQRLRDGSQRLRDAMSLLTEITGRLPVYIGACADFQQAWDEERALLTEKLEELEGLREFYVGFSDAYDELIIEIQRRRQVRRNMDKIVKHATAELQALFEDDLERRDSFRENQAEFIPNDLWPGLTNAPTKWKMIKDDEVEDGIPDIKKSIYELALKRVKERVRQSKRPP